MRSFFERAQNLIGDWRVLLIFCFVLFFLLLFPMLSGSKILLADATELMVPQLTFFKDAFAKGESPFWNPYVAVGFPNFISNLSSPFAPVVQLARILPPIDAHYWYLWFILSLTLFFSVRFLHELGIGTWGSLIGGLSYIIGDFYWAQNATVVNVLLVQAVLFWVIMRILKSSGRQKFFLYSAIGSLAVAWGWLTTVVYFGNLYIFTTLLAFVVFLGIKNGKIVFYRLFAALAISFLFGSLLGALQLVPVYIMAQFSGRSAGLTYQAAQGYALGLKEFLNFVHLTPRRGLEAYLYLGIAPLMFLIFSFFSKNPIAKFFRWVFLIALAISIKGSPLFWLIIHLPLFSYFQGAARFMFVGAFAGAVLVGFGCEYVLSTPIIKKHLKIITIGIAILMLLAMIVFRTQATSYSVIIAMLFLIAAYSIFASLFEKPFLLPLLTILTILDLFVFFYAFNMPFIMERRSYEIQPATSDFFKKYPGRVLPLFVDDWDNLYFNQMGGVTPYFEGASYFFDLERETYRPNYQNLDNVETLEANEPLLNVEMGRLMALLGTRQLVTTGGEEKLNKLYRVITTPTGRTREKNGEIEIEYEDRDLSVVERLKTFGRRLPLVDFLGIKYILSAFPLELIEAKITALKAMRYIPLNIMGEGEPPMPMIIYENPNAKPLAYFTKVSGYKSDPDEIYKLFKAGDFKDFYVECSDCAAEKFTGNGEIFQIKKENGLARFKTISDSRQFLVFTQNYLPGWRAFIDGKEVKMFKVNTVFPGVFVPAGEHEVIFEYDYWSLFSPRLIFGRK